MESINKKTEMNELRISKVDSRIEEIGSQQTKNYKNEMETPEGKYTGFGLCSMSVIQTSGNYC